MSVFLPVRIVHWRKIRDKTNVFSSVSGKVTVNHATINESQVFVYNLGTMNYIEDLIYPESIKHLSEKGSQTTTSAKFTTLPDGDVEQVPIVITEPNELDKRRDILLRGDDAVDDQDSYDGDDDSDDDEIVTPRALPVQYMVEPPK